MFTGPLQIENQAVNETSATRKHPLGTLAQTRDGRKFRYAKAGAADLVCANALVAGNPVANHQNCTVAVAAAVNAKKVSVTLGATAATADQYKDGYMVVQDEAGEGYLYQIDGNQAGDASTAIWVYLRDAVELALTTSSQVSLEYNPWDLVVLSAADQADCPVGIAHCAVDTSEAPYFWVQTGGPCPTIGDEATAAGDALTTGSSTAGTLEMQDAAGEPFWGHTVNTAVDGESTLCILMID